MKLTNIKILLAVIFVSFTLKKSNKEFTNRKKRKKEKENNQYLKCILYNVQGNVSLKTSCGPGKKKYI